MSISNVIGGPSVLIGRVRAALCLDAQTLVFSGTLVLPIAFAWYSETRWPHFALVIASFVFLFSLLRLLWLGPILSGLLSFSVMIGIYGASKFKFWLMGSSLHALDIYTYVHFDTLLYVKDLYPNHYLYLYTGLALFFLLAIAVLWFEKLKKPSRLNAAAFVLLLLQFAGLAYSWPYLMGIGFVGSDRHFHNDSQHTSTFILSAVESLPELIDGRVLEYGNRIPLDPQLIAVAQKNRCSPPSGAIYPNVVVILRESIVIPSTVQGMGVPQIDESRFASSDGRTYRLRVETFGGGTARTVFSLLTGLSVESFGALKNIAVDLTPGNLRYSLPLLMQDCGYRTVALTTGSYNFAASEQFFRSIGFQDYFNVHDILRRTGGDLSDKAIYDFLSEVMANKKDGSPTFAYVDTVVSHAPYRSEVHPKEALPDADSIEDPIIREYVRRLITGERALDKFIEHSRGSGLGGGRPLVALDFGDHQPYFTRHLPGHSGYVNEDRDKDDPHMLTYFRIRSTGPALAELPVDHAVVDVAFMSDWLVRALDLPIEGIYKIRWSIVERCKSRYWQCEKHAAAHELHQLLRAAGLVSYHINYAEGGRGRTLKQYLDQ